MVITITEPLNFDIHKVNPDKLITLYNLSNIRRDNKVELKLDLKNYHLLNVPSLVNDNVTNQNECYLIESKKQKADSIVQCSRNDNPKTEIESARKVKKKRIFTICTTNCKYEVLKRIATQIGMKEVSEDSGWNLCWTDATIGIDRIKDMKRFQKINHFPGMTEICRKDFLARNLKRMVKLFPKDYNFFPKTWCFPSDLGEAIEFSKNKRSKIYILKPYAGSQGRGIFLTRNLKDLKVTERMICQLYIAKPYTIDGFKFDLRVYALVTSCDPLRVYVYNDGLARFATSKYKVVTDANMQDVYMHLTNYTVNKNSDTFVTDEECGSKRTFSTLNKWWKNNNVNVEELWRKVDEIVVKTILAAYPMLKHSYNACFPNHDLIDACFELLGFDILLDCKLKPYLLEVNHSPSLHTDSKVDKQVKELLLSDTFEMLNLFQYSKKKIIEEDKKRVTERLWHGLNREIFANDTSASSLTKVDKSDVIQKQFEWESTHLGNYRRVYPTEDNNKYKQFFNQNVTSVFHETIASKAREVAVKQQKEEYDFKVKEDENKRLTNKINNETKVCTEGSTSNPKLKDCQLKNSLQSKKQLINGNRKMPGNDDHISFRPEIISNKEERERRRSLSERTHLMNKLNMLNVIYSSLRYNKLLSDNDKSRYGAFFEPRKFAPMPLILEKRRLFGPIRRYSANLNDKK